MSEDIRRRTYSILEAATILGLSRLQTYRAAQRGDLPSCRIGKRVLVLRAPLDDLLQNPEQSRQREEVA